MNNVRREETKSVAAPGVVVVEGQPVEGDKLPAAARLLLLRELAQTLAEAQGPVSALPAEEEEETEETLRMALAKMVLEIEESTVKLAELHSARSDHTVEMSKASLDDIDRAWDEMLKNLKEFDRLVAKAEKMGKIMKWVGIGVASLGVIATIATGGLASGVVMAGMVALQETGSMDVVVKGTASVLGGSEGAATALLSIAGMAAGGAAGAGKVAMSGATKAATAGATAAAKTATTSAGVVSKVAPSAADTVINGAKLGFVTTAVSTGGIVTNSCCDITRAVVTAQGKAEGKTDEEIALDVEGAVSWVKLTVGTVESLGMVWKLGTSSAAADNISKMRMHLSDFALGGGIVGSIGQMMMQVSQGFTQLATGDVAEERGKIEGEIGLLEMGSKIAENTMSAQGSHQRGLTQAREAMTQTYGSMMSGAWKTTADSLK